MAFQAESTHAGTDVKPFRKQYRLFHATFAQFCYTGAQVAIAGAFINYVVETRVTSSGETDNSTAARFLAGAQGCFTMGRFIGSAFMKFVKPRWVFLAFMTLCIVFVIPSITERGNTGMSMLYIVLFFESIIFPTIVALGMRGLGKYSKRGSGFIVAGVSGGAVVPPLLFGASDTLGKARPLDGYAPTAIAMTVPMAFGTMCLNTARAPPPPIMRIAWTYSRLRSDSASPRTRRAPWTNKAAATARRAKNSNSPCCRSSSAPRPAARKTPRPRRRARGCKAAACA